METIVMLYIYFLIIKKYDSLLETGTPGFGFKAFNTNIIDWVIPTCFKKTLESSNYLFFSIKSQHRF